jgi:hypothetical protein
MNFRPTPSDKRRALQLCAILLKLECQSESVALRSSELDIPNVIRRAGGIGRKGKSNSQAGGDRARDQEQTGLHLSEPSNVWLGTRRACHDICFGSSMDREEGEG